MGYLSHILAIPTLSVALVAWAAASRRLAPGSRGAAAALAVVLGCLPWILMRTDGINADGRSDFHWRWTMTREDRLLAQAAEEPKPLPPAPAPAEISKPPAASPVVELAKPPAAPAADAPKPAAPAVTARRADWPGFRGSDCDGVIRGVQIATDWSQSPPTETWRQPIGPGWSSFAVNGNLVYTQEQRGRDEVVSCTGWTPASRCGGIATPRGSGSRTPAPVRAARRRSATVASIRSVRLES